MSLSADDFDVPGIYLNSAARHPLPRVAAAAVAGYGAFLAEHRTGQNLSGKREEVRGLFARLIDANPQDIAFVPSTTFAESLLLQSLGLPRTSRGIVTDALHFTGSLARYRALQADGAPVTVVPQIDGRVDLDRLAEAITPSTGLVAVSSVSHWNGFRHDLPELCRIAHARGALVYADIIQEAGAMPFDVRASGVDFAACATYKWLLGDMGLAFLYVRRDRIGLLRPLPHSGRATPHPDGAAGLFELGTLGASAVEALRLTLPTLADGGVKAMQRVRAPLLAAIDRAFLPLPLIPLTPEGSITPIRAFAGGGLTPALARRLDEEGIRITARDDYLRLSPSCFNRETDIEAAADRIAAALS